VTSANDTAVSFTFASAEVGTDYAYSISDGSSQVTGSGSIATATDQISSIDVSGLNDGTLNLSVTLTDTAGNVGTAATDSVKKDATPPVGYSVSFDQGSVIASNETAISFAFASAEVGTTYNYSIDDTNGGTSAITGSGTITTATEQISGLDVSGLDDDTLTLTVYLTDTYGNQGNNATDTVTKSASIPTSVTVTTTGPWAPYWEDGTYAKQASLYNGKVLYFYNDGIDDFNIFWEGSRWVLNDPIGVLHYNNTSSDIPPKTGWVSTDGTSSMTLSY
jgi:hypothetical protein